MVGFDFRDCSPPPLPQAGGCGSPSAAPLLLPLTPRNNQGSCDGGARVPVSHRIVSLRCINGNRRIVVENASLLNFMRIKIVFPQRYFPTTKV